MYCFLVLLQCLLAKAPRYNWVLLTDDRDTLVLSLRVKEMLSNHKEGVWDVDAILKDAGLEGLPDMLINYYQDRLITRKTAYRSRASGPHMMIIFTTVRFSSTSSMWLASQPLRFSASLTAGNAHQCPRESPDHEFTAKLSDAYATSHCIIQNIP
ncbi:hypothetical protein M405DRAFT_846941 [Rhizopogon salebrosus TDB-379]|nr:hypothetical protein M405DRAFT_846941 [Rhizopogon salebrosus TDB-379]